MAKRKSAKTVLKIESHVLASKHIKLNDKEKKKLLETYDIGVKQLPKIRRSDPALEGLSVEVDDVVKIIRKSPTSGESIFFRSII